MTAVIPETHRSLLEAPIYVVLVTVMPDGQPQATLVWASCDGEYVYVNTARGRQKDKNMAARPMVTLFAMAPNDPYHWIEVRGEVIEMTEEGAVEHIDALALAYEGHASFFGGPEPEERRKTMRRVKCKIRPLKVNTH